jgi:KaiC/GvpD/RAD55 family RecA-like ATPase
MPGSGKSTAAAHFANSICASGKRCIYFAMELPIRGVQRSGQGGATAGACVGTRQASG